jgi:NitT/TauT family transport system permease protein
MSAAALSRSKYLPTLVGLGTFVLIILLIEILIRVGVINRFIVPLPSQIAGAFERVILEEDIL